LKQLFVTRDPGGNAGVRQAARQPADGVRMAACSRLYFLSHLDGFFGPDAQSGTQRKLIRK
jgi:hypothetical protein